MAKWFKDNWFKLLILASLIWFGYQFIMNQRFSQYIQCNSGFQREYMRENANSQELQTGFDAENFALCDIAFTHKSDGTYWIW